jgi:hypothetical protein
MKIRINRCRYCIVLCLLFTYHFNMAQVTTITGGNWTTPGTWSTGTLPGPGDDVIIRHVVTITNTNFSATVKSLTIENGTSNANATLTFNSGTATRSLTVLNNLAVTATSNNNCRILLQGSNTSAAVHGNTILTRNHSGFVDAFGVCLRHGSSMTAGNLSVFYQNSSDDNQEIYVRENSSMILSGDVLLRNTGGQEEPSLDVVDDAYFECNNLLADLTTPEAPSGTGRDVEVRVWDNGRLVVHGDCNLLRQGGRRIMVTIGNTSPAQASILVEGDMNIEHLDGLNHTNKDLPITAIDQCSLTVRGKLTATSTSARAINFSFSGNSRLDVDGDVSLTGTTNTNLTMSALNTSRFFFGGDIMMQFPAFPNTNLFTFAASSPNISTVTFDGSANQTVPGSETYGNLVINNTSHVTLAGNITVNNHLELTRGKVIAANRTVTLPLGATIAGSVVSYICNGKLNRGLSAGSGAAWFYVGDTVKGYSPVQLFNLSATSTFEVTYFPIDPGTAVSPGPYPAAVKAPTLHAVSNLEYWTIDRVAGTGAAQVALGWNAHSGVNDTAFGQLRVSRWDGTRWTDLGPTACTGSASAGFARTLTDIGSFSPFTLSSIGPDNFMILPVTPFAGSPAVTGKKKATAFRLFPNPVARGSVQQLQLLAPGLTGEVCFIELYDMAGRKRYAQHVRGNNRMHLVPVPVLFETGLYIVRIYYKGKEITDKLLIQ